MTISTPGGWAATLLATGGLPVTSSNVAFLAGWQQREGQWGASGQYAAVAQHNPLNTTLSGYGGSPLPGTVGIQSYPSWSAGIAATLKTLAGYPDIIAALKSGSAMTANNAGHLGPELSTWSGGGYTQVGDPSGLYSSGGAPSTGALGGVLPSFSGWGKDISSVPGDVASAVGGAAGDVLSGAESAVIGTAERVALAVVGAVFVLAGLVVVASAAGASPSLPSPSSGPSGPSTPVGSVDAAAPTAAEAAAAA